jgi:hypothetical protein
MLKTISRKSAVIVLIRERNRFSFVLYSPKLAEVIGHTTGPDWPKARAIRANRHGASRRNRTARWVGTAPGEGFADVDAN